MSEKHLFEVVANSDFILPGMRKAHVRSGEIIDVYQGKRKTLWADIRGAMYLIQNDFVEEFDNKTELTVT